MPKKNHPTATISIRVPLQVREWIDENGGGDFAKSLIISEWYQCSKLLAEVGFAKIEADSDEGNLLA